LLERREGLLGSDVSQGHGRTPSEGGFRVMQQNIYQGGYGAVRLGAKVAEGHNRQLADVRVVVP
jgi:hypothetical protein